jgi:type I restriction enzyme, S subunit
MSSRVERAPLRVFVSKVVGGGTPARSILDNWIGSIPWASVKDLTDQQLEFNDTKEHISVQALRGSAANLIPAGTPIVCSRMAVGRVSVPTVDVAINQDLKALFPASDISARYLVHGLVFLKPRLEAIATGSTVKGIRVHELLRFQLLKPIGFQQRRIAEILDELDGQIRAAELVAEKLFAIERAILEDLLAHLPNESYVRLVDHLVVSPKNGYSPVAAPESTGEYVLGLGCLTARGFVPRQLKNAPSGDSRMQPFLLCDGDVLISRSNTRDLVGLAGVFRDVGAPSYYPDLMMRLVPSNGLSNTYLASVLNSQRARRQIMSFASGTSGSMVKIKKSTVETLRLPIPSRSEQDRIEAATRAVTESADSELQRLRKLRLLKAGVMDDLLTGRLQFPEGAG